MRVHPTPITRRHPNTNPRDGSPHPDLLRFLRLRLLERLPGAEARRAVSPDIDKSADRAVMVLDALTRRLEAGDRPDPAVMRLLVHTFREHPHFRPEWAG